MTDFPAIAQPRLTVVASTWSVLFSEIINDINTGWTAVAAWPSSNMAIFVPLPVSGSLTVAQMLTFTGSASGNIDVGIYDLSGALLVSSGSTAQAGANAVQIFNVTDTYLGPGVYLMAVAMDNTTGTTERNACSIQHLRTMGVMSMASAFPLPATATFAAHTQAYVPYVGLTDKTVV